jgi:hypothetical protein
MIVMMGATKKPADAAAIASVPSLKGKFFVFQALSSASSTRRIAGNGLAPVLNSSGDATLLSRLKA